VGDLENRLVHEVIISACQRVGISVSQCEEGVWSVAYDVGMSEREKIARKHLLSSLVVIGMIALLFAYCDGIVHSEGEEVRYVGSTREMSETGCVINHGEIVEVIGTWGVFEDGENLPATEVMTADGCSWIIKDLQLEE